MRSIVAEFRDHSRPFLTLANKITIGRLVLIPVIVIGLLEHLPWTPLLLGFMMFTDLLDGWAARLRGERTALGAFLDPLADKLMLTAVFMILTYRGVIPAWVFVVLFSRDLLIVLGWCVIYILTGSSSIQPRPLGKATTAIQMAAAFVLVTNGFPDIKHGLLWAAVTLTAVSCIDYLIIGERRLGGLG